MQHIAPDALIVPESRKSGSRLVDRVASITDIAEPLLGVERSRGERAYIRIQDNGKLFISKSIVDTINFPTDHPRSGQPRYQWVVQPDGSEFGYLVADSDLAASTEKDDLLACCCQPPARGHRDFKEP